MVIYADDSDPNGSWRVQAIPVSETAGFENRYSLLAYFVNRIDQLFTGFVFRGEASGTANWRRKAEFSAPNLFMWVALLAVQKLAKAFYRWRLRHFVRARKSIEFFEDCVELLT
jgi:hypothetical protein